MIPTRGYHTAKELLHEYFGIECKTPAACIEKALAWPAVQCRMLKHCKYFLYFNEAVICNIMDESQFMQELDMPTNIRAIILKL